MQYELPPTISEALRLRAAGDWQILAGGTDVYPSIVGTQPTSNLLDISRLEALAGVQSTADSWRIGALTSWSEVLQAELPASFDALKLAAREVGSVQIQNAASIAGNLCNASPAADGVPPLLILDARVELTSTSGTRELKLDEFILGNRRTALRPDEILTAILIPREHDKLPSEFLKLGSRKYLVISIAMVAVQLDIDNERRIRHARIAVGACSEVARRMGALERALVGLPVTTDFDALINPAHMPELAPIDDIRAPAEYRREAAAALVRRTFNKCLARHHDGQ